jgi:hypothetical protein
MSKPGTEWSSSAPGIHRCANSLSRTATCGTWDPTATIENFLASFPSDEETAEFESLQEREELADLGLYDQAGGVCELCTAVTQAGSLCEPCASYDSWLQERLGSWWR